jgi:phosphoribosyl-AMP cyclohydrolase
VNQSDWPNFDQAPGGCLPAIAQDAESGDVLMLAYMNADSFRLTLETGQAVYFSRSRNRLWRKGEQSGHTQQVEAVFLDCDADTVLLKVRQRGVACHEGYRSCFFRELTTDGVRIAAERLVDPQDIYRGGSGAE